MEYQVQKLVLHLLDQRSCKPIFSYWYYVLKANLIKVGQMSASTTISKTACKCLQDYSFVSYELNVLCCNCVLDVNQHGVQPIFLFNLLRKSMCIRMLLNEFKRLFLCVGRADLDPKYCWIKVCNL